MKALALFTAACALICSDCRGGEAGSGPPGDRKAAIASDRVDDPPIPPAGYTTPESYAGMKLVWRDEFDGDHLNPADWNFETGPRNDELQYYKLENTTVRNGYLIITAKEENAGGKKYTSSRLTTQNKRAFRYGRVDIRALMPRGQGLFPALWMLGASHGTVRWPKCGEIDIMETIGGGGRDNVCYGTLHWDRGGHVYLGDHLGLPAGRLLGDEFHVFSIIWTPQEIRWYLDDVRYCVMDITPAEMGAFQKEFFFLFNVALGGAWAKAPDATTVFPQRMVVDYIRVFQ